MRALSYLISTWFGFPSRIPSIWTPARILHAWLASHVISLQACLQKAGRSWREHHTRSDTDVMALSVITGIVMKWVTHTSERRRSGQIALRFIQGSVFEIYDALKFCAFVYRQWSTGGCQRSKRFIEPIYSDYLAESEHLLRCSRGHTARLSDSNSSVLPQRSNLINMIKLLNSPALKNLAIDEWDLQKSNSFLKVVWLIRVSAGDQMYEMKSY